MEDIKLSLIQEIIGGMFTREELSTIKEKILEIKNTDKKAEKGIVEFTEKELNSMPKNIKKLLIIEKKRCHLRQHPHRKGYEIRFRKDGYEISASGVTIELAKENFIRKLKTAKPKNTVVVPTTFNAFAQFYFDNFRAEKVTEKTLSTDIQRYNRYLKPLFNERAIKNITPTDCKTLIDKVKKSGKGKTADELHSLLNVIFKCAIAHGIIDRNPLATVLHVQHERKSGKALTKDEEQALKSALKGSQYLTAFMIMLYTGLRPNELETAQIQGDFIVAVNSKRKNKKVEYKKIPIIKALRPYLTENFSIPKPYTMREYINKILPDHILYDLRTTFYTRCDEYGVSSVARDEFVGHSSGKLTSAYRSLSDEYLLKEGEKLNEW